MTEIARRSAAAIESDRTPGPDADAVRGRRRRRCGSTTSRRCGSSRSTTPRVERYGYTRDEFLGGMTIKDIRPPGGGRAAARRHQQPRRRRIARGQGVAPSAPRRLGDRRRGHDRADRLRGPPRRARRGARRERAQAARAPAHGRGEDGGDRAARRRRRARLQQPADRDLRLHRDPARPRRRRGAGGDRPRRAPGGGPHAPAAGLQPAPGAAPEGAGPERDRRRDGDDAASHHRRRRQRGDAARGRTSRPSRPTARRSSA